MKTILFSLVASLALVTPAMGKEATRTAPFSEVVAKVQLLTAQSNAVAISNKVRLELAAHTNQKIKLIPMP